MIRPGGDMSEFAIEAIGLSKAFGPVQANQDINLCVAAGSVHAIVGENGAGKSTLMNMLFGFYAPDAGEIRVDGRPCDFRSPHDAHDAGIGMVHQHFMLVEAFSVLENVMLGVEGGPLLARQEDLARARLKDIEEAYGLDVDPDAVVGDLPVGLRQRVEILKALYRGAEILILDEPTGVLTPQESEQLFAIIEALSDQGKTVLFISHKLAEVMRIAGTITVMRRGRVVAERDKATTSEAELAELMVGKKIARACAREGGGEGEVLLAIEGLGLSDAAGRQLLKDISFTVRRGEIVGIAGVAGNGQTELMEILTGMRSASAGRVLLAGVLIGGTNAQTLRRQGVGHIAEDRLEAGAVPSMSAAENVLLGYHAGERYSRRGILDLRAIAADTAEIMRRNDVRPDIPDYAFGALSGGNQQKLAIGRELFHDPALLIAGQPTRGVDIGAVTRIHDQLVASRNAGKAVLIVSSDLDELLAVSDRIVVMCEGRISGELAVEDADEQKLGLLMAGLPLAAGANEGERPDGR